MTKPQKDKKPLPELWLGIARFEELDTFWVYPPIKKPEDSAVSSLRKEPIDHDFTTETWVESLHLEQKLSRT